MPETPANPYQLPPALLDWSADGAPHSQDFGDIYFSRDGGLDETDYVFLQQNRLHERWQALDPDRPGVFVIGETGFGTGLNFLAAWQLWQAVAPASWRLHFVSAECYPLSREQLTRALAAWPQLSALATPLLAVYPPQVRGFHCCRPDPRVTLQLLLDDAGAGFNALCDTAADLPHGFAVDAWFLDGFAPAKNPGMWTPQLFQAIGRLSAPGATFATFTAAGAVRRGLGAVGFRVSKFPGHGSKREMARGEFVERPAAPAADAPPPAAIEYWACPPPPAARRRVVVIGGGLAGTSTAFALARRGWPVTLLEAGPQLAGGASGNPQGMLYTKLSPQGGTLARFALGSYLHALNHYRELQRDGVLPAAAARWCGVLQFETDARLREIFAGQQDWIEALDAQAAGARAGCPIDGPALWFPRAGWLRPAAVCAALADHPLIDVRTDTAVQQMYRDGDDWLLTTGDDTLRAGTVVIATAHAANDLLPGSSWPLRPIRGQISIIPPDRVATPPRTVICHDGYLAPMDDGGLCIGATFDQGDSDPAVRAADHRRNLESLATALPGLIQTDGLDPATLAGRTGFRCTTPDYLPIAGAVPDAALLRERFAPLARNARTPVQAPPAWLPNAYVNVGHGSRGLTSTPICAELLAALITGEPRPLPRDLMQALSPARFVVRDLIRNKQ